MTRPARKPKAPKLPATGKDVVAAIRQIRAPVGKTIAQALAMNNAVAHAFAEKLAEYAMAKDGAAMSQPEAEFMANVLAGVTAGSAALAEHVPPESVAAVPLGVDSAGKQLNGHVLPPTPSGRLDAAIAMFQSRGAIRQ